MESATATIVMGDSINPSSLPSGLNAYAGYDDGNWPDFPNIKGQHPGVPVLEITVYSANRGDCLDIENGDATVSQAAFWVKQRAAAGVFRPVLYTSESNLSALVAACNAASLPRSDYRIWSAHYGAGKHICGPSTCGSVVQADGTQWIDHGGWDESLLFAWFFDRAPVPAPTPIPTPSGGDVQLPNLSLNSPLKYWVESVQALCKEKAAQNIPIDGHFGPSTEQAVKNVQTFFKIKNDGVVGPVTWATLLGL